MSLEELFICLQKILKNNGCQASNLSIDTQIVELGMSSVELTSALLEVEDQFEVLIPDDFWGKWKTIGDAIEYIAEYKQSQNMIEMIAPKKEEEPEQEVKPSESSEPPEPSESQ